MELACPEKPALVTGSVVHKWPLKSANAKATQMDPISDTLPSPAIVPSGDCEDRISVRRVCRHLPDSKLYAAKDFSAVSRSLRLECTAARAPAESRCERCDRSQVCNRRRRLHRLGYRPAPARARSHQKRNDPSGRRISGPLPVGTPLCFDHATRTAARAQKAARQTSRKASTGKGPGYLARAKGALTKFRENKSGENGPCWAGAN
jgi:hypothetical protein